MWIWKIWPQKQVFCLEWNSISNFLPTYRSRICSDYETAGELWSLPVEELVEDSSNMKQKSNFIVYFQSPLNIWCLCMYPLAYGWCLFSPPFFSLVLIKLSWTRMGWAEMTQIFTLCSVNGYSIKPSELQFLSAHMFLCDAEGSEMPFIDRLPSIYKTAECKGFLHFFLVLLYGN